MSNNEHMSDSGSDNEYDNEMEMLREMIKEEQENQSSYIDEVGQHIDDCVSIARGMKNLTSKQRKSVRALIEDAHALIALLEKTLEKKTH